MTTARPDTPIRHSVASVSTMMTARSQPGAVSEVDENDLETRTMRGDDDDVSDTSTITRVSTNKSEKKMEEVNLEAASTGEKKMEEVVASTEDVASEEAPTYSVKALRIKAAINLMILVVIDVALPLIIYYTIRPHFVSVIPPLLISAVPTAVWAIASMIWLRRVDYLGTLMVISFCISAILSVISGDPRVLFLREGIVTGVLGFAFFCTLFPVTIPLAKGRKFEMRPFTFWMSRQWMDMGKTHGQADYAWKNSSWSRWAHRLSSFCWALALLGEFIIRVLLIEVFVEVPVLKAVNIINIGLVALLGFGIFSSIVSLFIFPRFIRKELERKKAAGLIQEV